MRLSFSVISFITSICLAQGCAQLSANAIGQTNAPGPINLESTNALEQSLVDPQAQDVGQPTPPNVLFPAGPLQIEPFLSAQANRLSDIQWLLVLSIAGTGGAISWGVSHYVRHQTWQRIEFLRRAVKEFEQDPEIRNALKILDFEEYRDYYIPGGAVPGGAEMARSAALSDASVQGTSTIRFRMSDQLLCNALANHDQRAQTKSRLDYDQDHDDLDPAALRQYQIETALRDWFNKLLNGLEHFGYFIESGMFTEKELQPWLNYWIKLIGDPAYRRPGASKVYDALYSYVHHSGFFGVQKLFERFGYRILPSPYLDTDLLNLEMPERPSQSSESSQRSATPSAKKSPFAPVNAVALASGHGATPGYSTRLALTLAKASYLAYQDKQFVAEVVGRWGAAYRDARNRYTQPEAITQQPIDARTRHTKNNIIRHNFRYFNNRGRDTQAYLFRTDEFMVLAFRGSQEPQDWTTNFTTQLRNFTVRKDGVTGISSYKGRVHTGFFLAWAIIEKSVLAQMHRWRKALAKEGKTLPPLYITGHSLGGALATMAAAALVDHNIAVAGVYTFGQPRVGDRTFVSQLNLNTGGRVYRFVNNNDIVPHVPPPFSIWNPTRLYGHVGTAKYFDNKGVMIANYKFAARFADYTMGLLKGVFGAGFDLITDHSMEYYISHLDNALKEELEDKAAHLLERGDTL